MVVDDARIGMSLSAFAALIGTTRDCIQDWRARYPDFAVACMRAKLIRTRVFERSLIDLAHNGGDSARVMMTKFGLINCAPEEWKERLDNTTTISLSLADLVTKSMKLIPASDEGPEPLTIEHVPTPEKGE